MVGGRGPLLEGVGGKSQVLGGVGKSVGLDQVDTVYNLSKVGEGVIHSCFKPSKSL